MSKQIPLVVHATHEAGVKVGGIGSVLDGLLSAQNYNHQVARTVLVGPMNGQDSIEMERLTSPRNGLDIRYSSLHGIFHGAPAPMRDALQQIEQIFNVALLYGTRRFGQQQHEIILVDVTNPNTQQIDSFKFHLWEHYQIDCPRYSWSSEFNHYLTIAPPLFAALKALGVDNGLATDERYIIAHEWLGMPVVFAAQMSEPGQWRTIFYAHETATARRLIEDHSGHDTRFYNAMAQATQWGMDQDATFGDQDDLFKTPILKQATRCDNIFAVGDRVVEELRFLGGALSHANIDLVYNGIPATSIALDEKRTSKRRLQTYCQNLLGYTPDYVFTHVTRMVQSKALWRDLRVMEHLDTMLRDANKSAVLFVLSTTVPAGRRSEWVMAWEAQYGWPVGHRGDNGDLLGPESSFFFEGVEPFNQRATQSKAILINQFGWSRDRCGLRMPEEMEFMDIRKGSDLEFGQSIYEPFGIAQVEPLSFGTLCCVSNVCGCVGFVEQAMQATSQNADNYGLDELPNFIIADYTNIPPEYPIASPNDALAIHQGVRDWIEGINSLRTARTIFERLPKNEDEIEVLLEQGHAIAQKMSWEVVAADYLLPGLLKAASHG